MKTLAFTLICAGFLVIALIETGITDPPPPTPHPLLAERATIVPIGGAVYVSNDGLAATPTGEGHINARHAAEDAAAAAAAAAMNAQIVQARADEAARVVELAAATETRVAINATEAANAAAASAHAAATATANYFVMITVSAESERDRVAQALEVQQQAIDATRQAGEDAFNRNQIFAAETSVASLATSEFEFAQQQRLAQQEAERKAYAAQMDAYKFNRAVRSWLLGGAAVLSVIGLVLAGYAIKSTVDSRKASALSNRPIYTMVIGGKPFIAMNGESGPQLLDPVTFSGVNAPPPQPVIEHDTVRPTLNTETHARPPVRNDVLDGIISYQRAARGDRSGKALLKYLRRAKVMLLWGAQDSGKTEMALHLVAERENVMVLDPKPKSRSRWPSKCRIVGSKNNWSAIIEMLNTYVKLMNIEAERMDSDPNYVVPEKWLVVDEFSNLVELHKDAAASPLKQLIMVGREYGIRVLILSQSDDVTSLGFKGQGKLRNAFVNIQLMIDDQQTREVKTTWSETVKMWDHPGIFTENPVTPPSVDVVSGNNLDWMDTLRSAENTRNALQHVGELPQTTKDDVLIERIRYFYAQSTGMRHLTRLVYGIEETGTGRDTGNRFYKIESLLEEMEMKKPSRHTVSA